MGWSVSKHSEPERKLDLLGRRLERLKGALKRCESAGKVRRTAELVRLAVLAVIKGKKALLKEYPEHDRTGRQRQNLEQDEQRWSVLPTEVIVAEHIELLKDLGNWAITYLQLEQ
jgi:hypothetical protein